MVDRHLVLTRMNCSWKKGTKAFAFDSVNSGLTLKLYTQLQGTGRIKAFASSFLGIARPCVLHWSMEENRLAFSLHVRRLVGTKFACLRQLFAFCCLGEVDTWMG